LVHLWKIIDVTSFSQAGRAGRQPEVKNLTFRTLKLTAPGSLFEIQKFAQIPPCQVLLLLRLTAKPLTTIPQGSIQSE